MKKLHIILSVLFLCVALVFAQAVRSSIQTSSAAYENLHQISNYRSRLDHVFGYNSGPAQFLQVFDSATTPADGQVPIACIRIFADANFSISKIDLPLTFQNGIFVCNSTTGPTKTSGAADCLFYTQHDDTR